ncbi:transketolase family protein [Nibricoccus sp. IMCC34717]|uniref:transketolase family protein n=1 Tax=Nibricoccus sp. IMCC34717 TaxID=3034021 RepID=UPI00384D9577
MRNAFADEITLIGSEDSRVVMLSADIGNRLFDKLKAKQPDRFYNCGVAEANMISMAAGLASTGLRPVCYTITPFITSRCYEQIKIDVAYHEMPVVIVGTGSGLSYAGLGATHHSLEDIALMRSLPGMQVCAPADALELRAVLRAALRSEQPTYIRIGKKGEPVLHEKQPEFSFGRWRVIKPGKEVCLLSCGNMLPLALEVAERLSQAGISAGVTNCTSIKPLDTEHLFGMAASQKLLVTLEEHSVIGGFGSAVAEALVDHENPLPARLLRVGASDRFLHYPGEQEHARHQYGLEVQSILGRIQAALSR